MAGRPKGATNKATVKFQKALEKLGFDVPAELIKLYRETPSEPMKLRILDVLARYSHIKPATEPDEATSQVDELEDANLETLLDLAKKDPKK